MTPGIRLQAGAMRCDINPELGACIAGLWFDTHQVLRSTPAAELQSVRLSGSYPLVPYSNRVGYGQLLWDEKQTSLALNFEPEPHAIHGVGWEHAWKVTGSSSTHAELVYRHQPDASWPFAFESTQTIRLSEGALDMQMSVTNCADVAAPAGLGWHPYFAKSPQTHIAFEAQGRWEMGADKLPTERLKHAGLNCDCTSLNVDHCFDGWSGVVQLTEGPLSIRVSSGLDYLVVFTTTGRDNIAVEPVSHVNNALALANQTGVSPRSLGIRVLQPRETFAADMRIEVCSR
jgi:aldose 1-epimerase